MTRTSLRRAGALLFGREWQHALGRFLKVDPRTVRRWASGQNAVPAWVSEQFMDEITRRQRALNLVERLLNRGASDHFGGLGQADAVDLP